MSDCIFCKIVAGELPHVRIWEDDEFIAILDMFPNTKGMTLVLPKQHFDSDVFLIEEDFYTKYMLAVKTVQGILKKGLGVHRVCMIMEGMGVNHAHIKLYPLYGLDKDRKEYRAKDQVFFDHYMGYVSTQLGPEMSIADRQKVAEEILGK